MTLRMSRPRSVTAVAMKVGNSPAQKAGSASSLSRIGPARPTHMNVKQITVWIERNMKQKAIYDLLWSMPPSRILIFIATKKTTDFLDDYLYNLGIIPAQQTLESNHHTAFAKILQA